MEYLVAHGHDEHDVVWRYSLRKIDIYTRAAHERHNDELLDAMAAQHNPKWLVGHIQGQQRHEAPPGAKVRDVRRLRSLMQRGKHGR